MMTTPAQVDVWRALESEHQNLEFKEAKTGYDSARTAEYCVALANEGGGHLLFGIADKPPRPVVGTSACSNVSGMADSLFRKIGFRVDVEEVSHPDGRVVVFHIPTRPKGTAYHLEGKYLMRSGESLVPMSEDRLRAKDALIGSKNLPSRARMAMTLFVCSTRRRFMSCSTSPTQRTGRVFSRGSFR
jgi:ATP-dependent DNA helicase RecG